LKKVPWKFVKLTDEEINKLPFPETARKIGGLLIHYFHDLAICEKQLEEIRRAWNESIKDADAFIVPITEEEK
jgi:hypothetical protein